MTSHIVVLIPGITGSVLERNGRTVWGPNASAILRAIATGGISELKLVNDSPEDEYAADGMVATHLFPDVHLLPGIWKIDGYSKIAQRLKSALKLEPGVNYFEFAYDWRRDNRSAARRLRDASTKWLAARRETHPDAKLVLIGHSMGGLVARYFLEKLDGWRETHALITFGTPFRGSVNAVDALSNGVRKLGGLIDLSDVSRSFEALHQLLPIYPCIDRGDRSLVRLRETDGIPGVPRTRIDQAYEFHREIEDAVNAHRGDPEYNATAPAIHPIVGLEQPTYQSAVVAGGKVGLLRSRDGADEGGDGTVPRVSATPIEVGEERAVFAATRHASLQNADPVLTQVRGVLTSPKALGSLKAMAPITISLDIEDVYLANEPVVVSAAPSNQGEDVDLTIEDAVTGQVVRNAKLPRSDDLWRRTELRPLSEGIYRVTIDGSPDRVEPVRDLFLVANAS